MEYYEKKDLVRYFREAEKKDQKLGIEIENLILDANDHWVPYETVGEVLAELVEDGWEAVDIEGHLLGATNGDWAISLEPGSQFELSLAPMEAISQVEESYRAFMYEILPRLHERRLGLYAIGYQPLSSLDEISIISKQRYAWMYEHFASLGGIGHHMMKASAATQVSVDFSSEEDFAAKLRLGGLLSPYLSLLFDNSPFLEGKPMKERMWRRTIWQGTDPARTGDMPGSLEEGFSYQDVVDILLTRDPILLSRHGVLSHSNGKTIEELFSERIERADWEHLLSMFFFDVRVKSFLEVRMMDSLPLPALLSAVALLKGLMYSPSARQEAIGLLSEERVSGEDVIARILREGLREKTKEVLRQLVNLAGRALGEEAEYLAEAIARIESEETLSDQCKRHYLNHGLEALKNREVRLELL